MRKYGITICVALFLILIGYHFGERSFSDTSWRISPSPSSLKGKDQYDVIIVGGGFGGLSCGAFLAQNGYKVLLCEKNASVGGLCSSYTHGGYTFDYGAEDILGLGPRGSLTYLLRKLQMPVEDYFVKNDYLFVGSKDHLYVPAKENAFENALIQQYPSERTGIQKFFDKARAVYNERYSKEMIDRWGVVIPSEIAKDVMGPEWVQNYSQTHENWNEWSKKTYQQVLDEYIIEPEVKLLLCNVVAFLGKTPIALQASEVVARTFGNFFTGGFHAIGTPARFAEALAKQIETYNGMVLRGAEVEKIDVSGGAISGVQIHGKKYWSHVVVSDIDVRTLFSDLMPANDQTKSYLDSIRGDSLGRSIVCIHLAVQDLLTKYPYSIRDRNNQIFVTNTSRFDRSLAPDGCSVVSVRKLVNVMDFLGKRGPDLQPYIDKITSELMQNAIALVPELKEKAEVVEVVVPQTYETLFNTPNGEVFGLVLTKSGKRPYFKTPFPGLYMTSGSTQNGVGVREVVANGILCAHDIMDWKA